MEHTEIGANSSFDMFDFNALAFMKAATAHAADNNGLLFCPDLMQGNCAAGSMIPISPSSSASHAGDLQKWSFTTSDSLWASHDLPLETDQSFQTPPGRPIILHKAAETFTRNETQNVFSFTGPDHPPSHPFGGSAPQERVDTNYGYELDEMDDLKDEDEKGSQDGRSSQPNTSLSERRRRGRLNETLYILRSLVPKITKIMGIALLAN